MTYVLILCGAMLVVSAVPVLFRITRGPSTLDRAVAVDMLTSVLIGAIAVTAAFTRRADLMPLLVVLAVVGFIGSTALARFAKKTSDQERRVLTAAEVAAADAEFLAHNSDDDAPMHDVDPPLADSDEPDSDSASQGAREESR